MNTKEMDNMNTREKHPRQGVVNAAPRFRCAMRCLVASFWMVVGGVATAQTPQHDRHGHDDLIPADYPPPPALTEGGLEPYRHIHFSRRGTPFAHPFLLEPAFMDRDLRILYARTREHGDEVEHEIEIELEWAFTRRIGMMLEVPYVRIEQDAAPRERGIGDIAIAPRFLLIDTHRFLLSGNVAFTLPTGSERKGTGGGESSVAPFVTTWLDLGRWITLQTEFGVEFEDWNWHEGEVFYGAGLTYSMLGPALFKPSARHQQRGHYHYPPGLVSIVFEATGRTEFSRRNHAHTDDGRRTRSSGEFLLGLGYSLTDSVEVRGGYQIPVGGRREIDDRVLGSISYHF